MRYNELSANEDAIEVGLHHFMPVIEFYLFERFVRIYACVVDQDVQATEGLRYSSKRTLDGLYVRDICLYENASLSKLRGQRRTRLGIAIGDSNCRTLCVKRAHIFSS